MSGHTPATPTTATTGDRKSLVKAFAASLSGTSLEWYDFAVYGAAAALVFGDLFFPSDEPLTGTLLAFGTYAAGYVARPLGGIVFGRLGDRVGRKRVLIWTLMLIGVATVLIGLLPTHGQVGILAPILLVVLRFAQGVGVGGEWGGAVLLSSEYSTPESRGFWASAAQVGPPLGNVLANAVLGLLAVLLSDAAFQSWGWRVAFLLSGVLVAFGLWIRTRLEETPVFQQLSERGEASEQPIKDLLSEHPRGLVSGILCRVGPDVLYAMFVVFVLTYATDQLDFSKGQALTAVMIASLIEVPLIPFAGWLSDRIDRRVVYGAAAIGAGIWVWVFLAMTRNGGFATLVIGVTVALALHAFMYGPQAAFIAEQFHARLRYTGTSLAYTFAGIIGGAVAPAAFTWLLSKDESGTTVAAYVVVSMLITLIGLSVGRKVVDDVDIAPAKVAAER
jgi:MFS family permease